MCVENAKEIRSIKNFVNVDCRRLFSAMNSTIFFSCSLRKKEYLPRLLLSVLCLNPVASWAQQSFPSNVVDLRYENFLNKPERQKSTSGNQFGEQFSMQNGALSFSAVDVALPGNDDLPVEFRRTLTISPSSKDDYLNSYRIMGLWELGLPKVVASYQYLTGPVSSDQSRKNKVCSITDKAYLSPPADATYPESFPALTFWNAPSLQIPGVGNDLLVYNQGLMPSPSSGRPYFWLTSKMDYVSCIDSLRNSGNTYADERNFSSGEGFFIERADGTKYWFDWIALERRYRGMSTVLRYIGGRPVISNEGIDVARLGWYPTRIEDRHGNWVRYSYSNKATEMVKLDRIDSSDGRVITLNYTSGVLSSVVANGYTWSYSDSKVINPDGSSWSYEGTFRPSFDFTIDREYGSCRNPSSWSGIQNADATTGGLIRDQAVVSVTNPAGATARFLISKVMLGRSQVPWSCYGSGYSMANGLPTQITEPTSYLGGWTLAVVEKSISGPGLTNATWKYNYQSDIWFSNTNQSPGTSRTKVLAPDGVLSTYIYGNAPYVNDGLLLSVTKSVSGNVKSMKNFQYASSLSNPDSGFPKRIGWHPYADLNQFGAVFLRPQINSVTSQEGTVYTSQVSRNCNGGQLCIDAFGRTTQAVKSTNIP
ncbi:UNVERIFIED_ORG: hypothetical protein GGR78_003436 [Xanthomonas campestris]